MLDSRFFLSHSANEEVLSAIFIIAPTGIYRGRVKQGVDLIMDKFADKSQTKTRILLVPGLDWISFPNYRRDHVEDVKSYVLKTWKELQSFNVVCDEVELSFETIETMTGWLLSQLFVFFRDSENSKAFIDLTAGPKEWVFAAINAANFFPNVALYNVKARFSKSPDKYETDEKDDRGIPKWESITTGGEALSKWLKPEDEDQVPNLQYYLLRTIVELARSAVPQAPSATNDQRLEALTKVDVPISEQKGLSALKNNLPQVVRDRFVDDSALKKSISKCLTGIRPYGLFQEKGKSLRMAYRTAMITEEVFKPVN